MRKDEIMGTGNITRLIIAYSVPAIVGQLVMALYNIVDRFYIGQVLGKDGIAGLTLTMPYMMLLASFGTLIGVGSGALLSIRLGEQRRDEAEKLLGQMVFVKILFFLTIPIIAYLTLNKTLSIFGGTPEMIPYAHTYMKIILIGNIFSHLAFGMSNLMRSEGNSFCSMVAMLIGAGLNIVLDPIFIFVFDMGIAGAAWATNIAMLCSALYGFRYFTGGKSTVKLHWNRLAIYKDSIGKVFGIGLSPFCLQLMGCIVQIFLLRAFSTYGENSNETNVMVSLVGISQGIIIFALMPIFGIGHGVQPLIGYNYGAAKFDRVIEVYKKGMIWATGLCLVGMIIGMIFAYDLVKLFTRDEDVLMFGATAMRISFGGFIFIGASVITTTYFQSIGRATVAIILSLLRQAILLVPLINVLPMIWGVKAIWFAAPLSDFLSFLITSVIIVKELRKLHLKVNQSNNIVAE